MRRLAVFRSMNTGLIYSLLRKSLRLEDGCCYLPVTLQTVPLDDLRTRRQPLLVRCNSASLPVPYRNAVGKLITHPIDRFFPLVNGKQDRRIRHTPHCKLLKHYQRTGEKLYDQDYTRLLAVRTYLGGRSYSKEYLHKKVDSFFELLKSIQEHGYMGGPFRRSPIVVFEKPIYPPDSVYEPLNYEMVGGHHRAAAAAVLGMDAVKVLVVRATKLRELNPSEWIPWDEALWSETALQESAFLVGDRT